LLALVFALVWAAAFLPGPVLITGYLHDLFLPLNAARVIDEGLRLHEQYHSPFGWVFFYVSSMAMSLREAVAPESSATGVMLSAALVFFVVIFAVFVLLRTSLGSRAMPVWLMPFLLVLGASPRNQEGLGYTDLLWYGMYNNQLWTLLLLQLSAFFSLLLSEDIRGRIRAGGFRLIPLSVAQALVLYVALNYKISFFVASLALALASLIVIGWRRALMPFMLCAAAIMTMLVATHLAGYSYQAYVADLMMAVRAREEGSTGLGEIVWPALVLLGGCVAFLDPSILKSIKRKGPATSMTDAIVSMALALAAMVLGLMGDYSKSMVYLFIFVALFLVANHRASHESRWGAPMVLSCGILAVVFSVNALSVVRVIDYKISDIDKKRYVVSELSARWGGEWHVAFPRPDFGSQIEELAGVFGKQDAAWFGLALKPVGRIRQMYGSVDYMVSHQEVLSLLEEIGAKPDAMVVELEFANSFPVLWGSPTPPGSLHWIHQGTTISNASYIKTFEPYYSADIVLLPTINDAVKQPQMNCLFLIENGLRGHPFQVRYVDRYWVMLAARNAGLSWPTEYTGGDQARFDDLIDANCSDVAPLFYGSDAREKMDAALRAGSGHR
jgi:hypothetical protein